MKSALMAEIAAQAAETGSYLGAPEIDPRVMAAIGAATGSVPREDFLPDDLKPHAYDNRPLPIGHGQTISQPYIVAAMTHLLRLGDGATVLEVGTGCGYQAAVLSQIAARVVTVETLEPLARAARERLAGLGVSNVTVHRGDGRLGWPEEAPYDGILVTAAPVRLPPALPAQLKPGARLVIPIGGRFLGQKLMVYEKQSDGSLKESCGLPVAFVPLVKG